MAAYKTRIALMQALVSGSAAISSNTIVRDELAEVNRSRRVTHLRRRRLLQVLHSTRALDTTLSEFVRFHNCWTRRYSLGAYLDDLVVHKVTTIAQLPHLSKTRFKRNIANVRNRFMHAAGTFPLTESEVDDLLSEMHDCLAEVLAL